MADIVGFTSTGGNNFINATVSRYFNLMESFLTNSSTEVPVQVTMRTPGVWSKLYIRLTANEILLMVIKQLVSQD